MSLAQAQAVGGLHGLRVASLQPLSQGSVNSNFRLETEGGQSYFLRLYEEQDAAGAAAELELVRHLGALGVPTPTPVPPPSTGLVRHAGKPVGIYPWVEGEILCQARVTEAVAHALGASLARVHSCTDRLPRVGEGRFSVADVRSRLDRIDRETSRFASDTARIRERLRFHESRAGESAGGLIHGDLFRDNVLWRPGSCEPGRAPVVAALIDFESASRGCFAYDIMVCVHAWCFAERYQLELAAALLGGYESVRPLPDRDRAALLHQGALGALRFAATRISDFSMRTAEGEQPVRDYRRFLRRLDALEAGELDPIITKGKS